MEAEGMAYTDHDPRFDNRQPTQDTDVPVMTNLADIHEDGGVGNSNNNSDEDQGNTNVDSSLITSNQTGMINSGMGSMVSSAHGLHRRRTLYLIRHGEATHNVLEKAAQDKARAEAMELGLSPAETHEMMEEARKAVLTDASLRDAPLTDEGRKQAREAAALLEQMVSEGKAHPPTEAMCSPLTRCLQTCQILLQQYEIRAHVRLELQERQTLYPPDTPKPLNELMKKIRTESFNEEGIDGGQDSNCSPGRFILNEKDWKTSAEDAEEEAQCRESKEMLRERASQLFDMLLEMEHRHVLVVSHKG
jgi:broad specificity phosphatase PhoE